MPLSSSMNSPTHTNLPHWPIHTAQSFLLSAPPLSRMKAHPKLQSANAREPPVPPGLVKRLSAGLHYQTSEESSDRSDGGDPLPNNRLTTRPIVKPSDAGLQRTPFIDNRTPSELPKVVKHKGPVRDTASSDHVSAEESQTHPSRSETLVSSSTVSQSTSTLRRWAGTYFFAVFGLRYPFIFVHLNCHQLRQGWAIGRIHDGDLSILVYGQTLAIRRAYLFPPQSNYES